MALLDLLLLLVSAFMPVVTDVIARRAINRLFIFWSDRIWTVCTLLPWTVSWVSPLRRPLFIKLLAFYVIFLRCQLCLLPEDLSQVN